jgi:hypothetical protein
MSRPAPRTAAPSLHTTLVRAIKGTILLGVAAAGMAQAQQSPALDRVSISAGAFYADPEIHLGGDTRYGRVDTPDEEISDVTLPRVKGEVLIGDSHGISFDYFRFDEGYGADLKGDTVYEGRPVSGSLRADANLRIELARLSYKMWFGKEKNVFGVGLGAAHLRAKISGSASASESVWAPTVELAWRHALNDQVRFYAEASGVKKNGGNVEGHIYNGALGVEYFPHKNIGLVLDYGIQKIDLHRNGERTADIDLKLTGPSAYVKVRF